MKTALKITLLCLGLFASLLLSALFYYLGVTAGVRLDPKKLTLDTACLRVFDGNGEQIETAARTSVSLSDLPSYVPNAFVAVEDKRFYSHNGLDGLRIGKAMLKNAMSFSFREGASTISQQLIKNTHLTSEKTVRRKLREFKLTRQLEKRYSKEEILELYLNSIYFGHDAYGIGRASALYFGKDAEELTPAESAMLAALVRSPGRYSPFRDPDLCLSRRNFVLRLMKEQGYLDEEQTNSALQEPLPAEPVSSGRENPFLAAVFRELDELGLDSFRASDSLRIYTGLDPTLQEMLCSLSCDSDEAAIVLDNFSHTVKAFASTCGEPKRLPASTLKPLLVYAPAIEEDLICPATPILDAKTDFSGYSPDDAGGASGEYMSARDALSGSVNIPAVKILNALGCEKAANYLGEMGLFVEKDDRTLALALGGMKEGFPLASLADGYATLACNGIYAPSHFITKVENGRGDVLYQAAPMGKRVFSEETSWLVSDMLRTAASEGTARKLRTLPFPVCAKTGTAEGKAGNTDAYTIAYTSDATVAVWMGNRDNSPIDATGGGLPACHVRDILAALYVNGAPTPFPTCDGVVELSYDRQEYEQNHRLVLSDPHAPICTDRKEHFKKDAVPSEVSTRYTLPKIQTPQIYLKNGAVNIVLCQTEYYDYEIKRENRGETVTIYKGKYQKVVCDNSVRAGESYRYFVTPHYKDHVGETVTLPAVHIGGEESLPKDWWDD